MTRKQVVLLSLMLIAIGILFLMDLMFGSVSIPFRDVLDSLMGKEIQRQSWQFIIQDFRLPKAIMAILAGTGLAVAGMLMQTLFRNPLAGPSILGISSGASLGVAVLVMANSMVFGSIFSGSGWEIILASICGSMLVMFLILLASVKVTDNASLLIIGMMLGSLTGAVVLVLQYFSSPELIKSYLVWTFGSLAGVSWEQLSLIAPITFLGLIISFAAAKSLNAFLLGENYARSLGVSVGFVRVLVIVSSSILAGVITAFCGPIAFVGMAVPHLARLLLNTSDHKLLIPYSALLGAAVMLFCDIISQAPGYQNVFPINAVTALIGSPVVIWVIIKMRNHKSAF